MLGLDLEPDYFDNPHPQFYQNHTEADVTEARRLLGYTPREALRGAIEEYLVAAGVCGAERR